MSMASKDEEFFGVLYSILESFREPCSVDTLCLSERSLNNKTDRVRSALQTMCEQCMVARVNGDKYILSYKLQLVPEPQPSSYTSSLSMDGASLPETPDVLTPDTYSQQSSATLSKHSQQSSATMSKHSQQSSATMSKHSQQSSVTLSKQPYTSSRHNSSSSASRLPNTSSGQSITTMPTGNLVGRISDALNGLEIYDRNNHAVTQQRSVVQSSSQSMVPVDTNTAQICYRQLSSIITLLKNTQTPMLAKDIAQQTSIGQARSDVNRFLYFLEKKGVLCQTGDKKRSWKLQNNPSENEVRVYCAELAKIPDSNRSKKKGSSTALTPSSSQASNADGCDCPNRGPTGCLHVHQHHHITNYNVQVGEGNQMNTAISETPALNPPDVQRRY